MRFDSTAEGRVGVEGADKWRKTVPHVGIEDRACQEESPPSELGPRFLYRGCSGRSEAVVRSVRVSDCAVSRRLTLLVGVAAPVHRGSDVYHLWTSWIGVDKMTCSPFMKCRCE